MDYNRVEIVIAENNLASLGVVFKAGTAYECLARNRLQLHGKSVEEHVLPLVPRFVARVG